MRKLLVLGAGGIIGQHLQQVCGRDTGYVRSRADANLYDRDGVHKLLDANLPAVVINLAGENRVDVVEGHPQATVNINIGLPMWLAEWCDGNDAHLIQVSTQGVFSGDHAPYRAYDVPHPRTEYGAQKAEAEQRIAAYRNWTIARATFVLGVRPQPTGRVNPLEQMFALPEQRQVNDKFFSPAFAADVAGHLNSLADDPQPREILHLGLPIRVSRYDIAKLANPGASIEAVSDRDFPGASRPADTSWAVGSLWTQDLVDGISSAREQWKAQHVRPDPD